MTIAEITKKMIDCSKGNRHDINHFEADCLVNADESRYSRENIEHTPARVFRTKTGTDILKSMYLRP